MAESKLLIELNSIYHQTKLTGERVFIRALSPAYITDQYSEFYAQQDLVKYMYQTPRKASRQDLIAELESGIHTGQFHIYGIFDVETQKIIGNLRVGIMNHIHKISDLVVFIGDTRYLGKGLAQEAIKLGNKLCFEYYDFRKLHGGMFQANIASIKAYLKTGWVIEGLLKGQYWVDQKPMDRVAVACFNPKYFTTEFLEAVTSESNHYLSLISGGK